MDDPNVGTITNAQIAQSLAAMQPNLQAANAGAYTEAPQPSQSNVTPVSVSIGVKLRSGNDFNGQRSSARQAPRGTHRVQDRFVACSCCVITITPNEG